MHALFRSITALVQWETSMTQASHLCLLAAPCLSLWCGARGGGPEVVVSGGIKSTPGPCSDGYRTFDGLSYLGNNDVVFTIR